MRINTDKSKIKYNILTLCIYIIGAILLIQLFNLQIINGKKYREQSNTRLTRESVLHAARGQILDRTGNPIVSNYMGFRLDLYKTKVDNQTLNNNILNIVNVLEKNGDKYADNFPIKIEPFEFESTDIEYINKWKIKNNIDVNASAEECFNYFKDKYDIQSNNLLDTRKIIAIRYEISQNGYSSTKGVQICKNVSRQSVMELSEMNVKFGGIDIVTEPIVNYVSGSLASHILGTVGKITQSELEGKEDLYNINDIIGKTGIEYVFEDLLRGKNGIRQIDMDIDGTITGEYIAQEAVAGSDVVLTIDSNMQEIAEEALENNIVKISTGGFSSRSDANAGAVVVMNVKTGEILAMASYPDYEPQLFVDGISNEKYEEYNKVSALFNRAISGTYAPGSIYKMVTAIAGLQEGVINKSSIINDTGVYPYAHKPVCWLYTENGYGHGGLNVSQAIKHSCNYFFYEVGNRIGIEVLEKYAKYFGLGTKTNVELPSEASGVVASKERANEENRTWYLGETLSASIGQSYNNFTPLQMAKYISMLANGGKNIDVTLIKTVINGDGTELSKEEIEEYVNSKLGIKLNTNEQNLNISEENLNAVLEGMKGVTSESGGTAYSTFSKFDVEVAGKTGTAQVGNKTNGWFAGFAPYDEPEIAVVVVVENVTHGVYTAEVARDIFAEYFGMNVENITENQNAIPSVQIAR
ncbi:MAG: penicillin-binding protein 2 [Clostridiales bacterium]|nr:penicillin-binding protein 2 [Clostridiales bacterium]